MALSHLERRVFFYAGVPQANQFGSNLIRLLIVHLLIPEL